MKHAVDSICDLLGVQIPWAWRFLEICTEENTHLRFLFYRWGVWLKGVKWLFKVTTHWGRVHIIGLFSAVSQSLQCSSEIIVADQTRPEESDVYTKPKSAYSCLMTMPFQRDWLWVDVICPTWQVVLRELFDTFAFLFGFERGSHCVAHFPTRDNYPAPTFQMLADTPGFVCVWHFLTHGVDLENIKFWLQIPPLFLRKQKAATNVETLNIMEFWQRTGPKVSKNGHSQPLPSWE